ncbi:putative DNA oxidative demethylase [Heracleum sosnowskyi]|uniref:DNA oxidative demethylase n=1 Tax=Heracleum sosnowskyi TaxID=360622 RepID=A0AAD8J6G1_9APIA|nr:putative DNA oxidative demethylase [Heracleum sosnowskyi]
MPIAKSRRRTRVDLRTPADKNSSQKSVNAANSIIQEDHKSLSICDEEKSPTRPKGLHQDMDSEPRKNVSRYVPRAKSNPKNRRAKELTGHAEKQAVITPFDICTCYNRKSLMGETFLPARNTGNHIDTEHPITETRQILRPGMVLLTNYISLPEQVNIINRCRELGLGPGGFCQPGYQNGAKLRLQMMCLGKMWDPETKYEERSRSDVVGTLSIPDDFVLLVKKALSDAHLLIEKNEIMKDAEKMLPGMTPDVCIVNFYTTHGKLGLHQDRDESEDSLNKGLPVISFSVGDSAEFLYGDERDISKAESILLKSGDVLIFGGQSRHIYHGVTSIIPNTAPPALLKKTNLCPGRLNLTFRHF